MNRLATRVSAVLSFTFATAIAGAAFAQASSTDAALATELFNAGRDLMKDGNFVAACPKLAESARLDAKVGTLARLAECDEKLGHLASARGNWQKALNLARTQKDSRQAHVQEELARVDATVPKVNLTYVGTTPPGLVVKIDDVALGEGSFGVPLPVDPGKHVVLASAPGKNPWSSTIELKGDGSVRAVAVPALVDEASGAPVSRAPDATPTPAPSPAQPDKPASSGRSTLGTVGLVAAGVGVVGLGVGGYFGLHAKSKYDDSNKNGCDEKTNDCSGAGTGLRNDARDAGNLSTVFVVAGGVLAAGGLTLWLLSPGESKTSVQAGALVLPSGGSVSLSGSF